jgi:hypothetical protein
VEFEHHHKKIEPQTLKDGDYVGDFSLLGDADWASSTCLALPPGMSSLAAVIVTVALV